MAAQADGAVTDGAGLVDNRGATRFEWSEEGQTVYADYRRDGNVVVIAHVFTPPPLRGRGAASRLMAALVAKARADGFGLRPTCSYAAQWFAAHAEAGDVLA